MPRLNLTDEEAEIIKRRRELERIRNLGWNDAIDKVITDLRTIPNPAAATVNVAELINAYESYKVRTN